MKKRNQVTIGLIAAIVLLACACPVSGIPGIGGGDNPSDSPTPSLPFVPATEEVTTTDVAPTDVAAPTGNVLYSDDFSAPSSEMEEYTGDGGSAGTENGAYVVKSTADLWQWGKSNSQFDNTIVDVDVTMVVGPSNNNAGFGIACRLTENTDTSVDGYMLAISGDGYYTIRTITASNMSALVDWTFSDVINQGNASNHIRATCNGTDLSLEVNGQVVATATAPSTTSGSIAFAAISFETNDPIAEIHFDNMVVTQPQ